MPESQHLIISSKALQLSDICQLLQDENRIALSAESATTITKGRELLERILSNSKDPIYGINTGFGSLCNTRINDEDLEALQHNLVRSHSAGFGALAPAPIIRLMLAIKAKSLSGGFSGVRLQIVERLLEMYNQHCTPLVYELGSLGASGDLAPLAHLSLPLIGEGQVWLEGRLLPSAIALQQLNLPILSLKSKEGLALLNGTQFSTAFALFSLVKAWRLWRDANQITALSIEGFNASATPFDARIHAARPHAGQQKTAEAIRQWLKGSEINASPKQSVQDPYAFRCVPQVHGATYDALIHVTQQLMTEVNSVTDNPNIFADGEEILSGGNFHAQPVALVADYLAIAVAEMGSISERRIYQLIGGKAPLPPFLTENPGLHSGMMIAQYTAASIASQNKQLCTPASVDSIISCNGQEDHVSMAANAATKLLRVVENTERILAIELMIAAQAIEFRRPLASSPLVESWLADFRKYVAPLKGDRVLHNDMEAALQFLHKQDWYTQT